MESFKFRLNNRLNNVSKEIPFIMTELHQSSSHFQVIDTNPTKRIMNK